MSHAFVSKVRICLTLVEHKGIEPFCFPLCKRGDHPVPHIDCYLCTDGQSLHPVKKCRLPSHYEFTFIRKVATLTFAKRGKISPFLFSKGFIIFARMNSAPLLNGGGPAYCHAVSRSGSEDWNRTSIGRATIFRVDLLHYSRHIGKLLPQFSDT